MNDRLYRSRTDRVISGICGGIADRFDLDPSLVRVGFAVLWLFTGIVPFTIIYILMSIVVPEEPAGAWAPPGAPGGIAGWTSYGPAGAASGSTAPPPADSTAAAAAGPGDAGAAAPAADAASAAGAPDAATGQAAWAPGAAGPGDWRARQRADRDARRAARRASRAERRADPMAAIIVGLVLILIGAWFLLRNVIAIEWSVVWPAAIVAFGAVLVVIAVLPRSGRG
jgi:phage shock protein C